MTRPGALSLTAASVAATLAAGILAAAPGTTTALWRAETTVDAGQVTVVPPAVVVDLTVPWRNVKGDGGNVGQGNHYEAEVTIFLATTGFVEFGYSSPSGGQFHIYYRGASGWVLVQPGQRITVPESRELELTLFSNNQPKDVAFTASLYTSDGVLVGTTNLVIQGLASAAAGRGSSPEAAIPPPDVTAASPRPEAEPPTAPDPHVGPSQDEPASAGDDAVDAPPFVAGETPDRDEPADGSSPDGPGDAEQRAAVEAAALAADAAEQQAARAAEAAERAARAAQAAEQAAGPAEAAAESVRAADAAQLAADAAEAAGRAARDAEAKVAHAADAEEHAARAAGAAEQAAGFAEQAAVAADAAEGAVRAAEAAEHAAREQEAAEQAAREQELAGEQEEVN